MVDCEVQKVDVCNVIPGQMAGKIAAIAGVTDDSGRAPVHPDSMKSKLDENVFVLGDSSAQGDTPKSAFSANSRAKVAAMTIRAELTGSKQFPAKYSNTCWSLLAPDDKVKVGASYEPTPEKIASVESFVSATGEDAALRKATYEESLGLLCLDHRRHLRLTPVSQRAGVPTGASEQILIGPVMLTRRCILTTVVAPATPLARRRLWAASTLTLGSIQIDTLSDGSLVLPGDFILGGMPQDEMQAIVTKYSLSTEQLTPPCNVTLLRDATNTVLFDVGAGPDFQPTAGKIGEALDVIGLTADDITHVLFTHAHPDHLWGRLDEFDEPVFPNAQHMVGQVEFDYWMNPDTVNTISNARTTFAVGAQCRLLADGEEPAPGIAARLTPGDLAYEMAGPTPAMILGDCIGNHHVGFERPDCASGSDQDMDMAAATRVTLPDRLAAEKHAIIGYYLPNCGLGSAEKADTGNRFVEKL